MKRALSSLSDIAFLLCGRLNNSALIPGCVGIVRRKISLSGALEMKRRVTSHFEPCDTMERWAVENNIVLVYVGVRWEPVGTTSRPQL